ncbi:MAG: hypothetical protein IJ131_00430 [Eggerthellaceae bacterium]|nr:hypothetical protein [Eggerthellaceae bacterium]
MADPEKSIFNKKATDKLRSPDDLDKFIQVTNPNVWVVLAACMVLLAGLLAWGVFGSVTTSVSATGVSVDGSTMCFLSAEDVAKVHVNDVANVGGATMTVSKVSQVPLSHDEAHQVLASDYLVNTLLTGDWAYQVSFEGNTNELAQNVPLTVSITTERIAPISLILGSDQ